MAIKRIQLKFADPRIQARNHIRDICSAVENASHNLFMRHRVRITPPIVTDNGKVIVEIDIPDEIKRRFSIGCHLRGISKYLLDEYGDRYKKFQVGKRLLHYIDIAEVSTEKQRLKEYIWQDSDDGYTSTRIRELIRCKDCINYVESIFGDGMFCGCDGMLRDPDWYCADGERKT